MESGRQVKKLFSGALIANLLVEGLAALVLIGAPQSVSFGGQAQEIMWARIYGFAALGMGSTVFWVWPNRGDFKAAGTALGILLTFHICITVALAVSGTLLAGAILHGFMSVLFVALYIRRSDWCTA